MGIPRLSQWLRSTFPDAFGSESKIEAEHVYIDLNSVLHETLSARGGSAKEDAFFRAVCTRLDLILELARPTRTLLVAIDGPAAAAKVPEQRRRRRARRSDGTCKGVTLNMLTPGVPVMSALARCLCEHLAERQADAELPAALRIKVSSSDEAGEGEHKIMVELRRNESAKTEEAHVIVGTDSDLLLVPLALLHGPKRVTVARAESPAELRVCRSEAVLDAMARQWNRFAPALVPLDEMHLRLDFLLVTCFRGNDYLPALACDCDPSELWPRYLRWRQSSQSLVGVELEDDAEKIVLMRLPFVDFLSQQGGAVLATSAGKTAEEASQYVEALLWCLETYATGCCPDPLRRFGASAPNAAHVSAEALARQLGGGEPGCFKAARSDAAFLTPLGCALAVLPVAEVRRLVLPFEPCLAPLLEEDGLLGKVAQLESCTECAALTKQVVAGPVSGKKAEKRRKALEVHRRQHQDIENVSLEELEAEVRRLQELRGDEPLGADAARPAAGESSAQKAELAGAKHKRARKRQRR